ncbi:porin [Psychrobacter sp. I-STPA6b]|uniref:porin n=1 Tax=Psychrobacter sp. I-STPA6b TaxID=2585718 RepID=UPI001D0C2179|nr:porin [Psychrobacter sp. I-STPA6b]
MKKLLLASAVAALSVSAAQAAPTVYGKAFLTLDATSQDSETTNKITNKKEKDDSKSRPALSSNFSRIGFKGSEALTANTDLVYQLEYGVNIDSSSGQFYARDTYLGLSNKQLGTVMAGRLTGIDDSVDFANVTAGGLADGVLAPGGDRYNNAFAYASPSYDGVQFLGMYALDENKEVATSRDGGGVAAVYAPAGQPFRAGASYLHFASSKKVAQITGDAQIKDAFRVSGSFDVSPVVTVGALYQLADYNADKKENAVTISGEMKTATPWTAYAQGDVVKNVGGADDADSYRVAVGGKYAFNGNTTGHVYGVMGQKESEDVLYKDKNTSFGIGGGLEYKF